MAGRRTYVPGLVFVLKTAARYIKRWQTQLQTNTTSEQYDHIVGCLTGIADCLALLPSNDPSED